MENSTIVETHSLTKRYGSGVLAVNSVDMSVRRGEVYGFLGPNGAGKTTTLRMLVGLIRPTTGTATVAGHAPGSPAGLARIEVRFLIDANGILNVTARDVRTGKEQSMDVKPSYGLSDQQVEAMILESFEKAQDDFKERQVREARVEADSILAAVKKARNDDAFRSLPAEVRAKIDWDVQVLLRVYNESDYLLIREKIESLNQSTHALAENMMNTAVRGALKGTKI